MRRDYEVVLTRSSVNAGRLGSQHDKVMGNVSIRRAVSQRNSVLSAPIHSVCVFPRSLRHGHAI